MITLAQITEISAQVLRASSDDDEMIARQRRADSDYAERRADKNILQRAPVRVIYRVLSAQGAIITREFEFNSRMDAQRFLKKQDIPNAQILPLYSLS